MALNNLKHLNVPLPAPLLKRIRLAAIREGLSIKDFVAAALARACDGGRSKR